MEAPQKLRNRSTTSGNIPHGFPHMWNLDLQDKCTHKYMYDLIRKHIYLYTHTCIYIHIYAHIYIYI
jgi:hypothetical protein